MRQELKEKWIAALKSGTYAQGREALREEDRYCCLGVLADVLVKECKLGNWVDRVGRPAMYLMPVSDGSSSQNTTSVGSLSDTVREKIGLMTKDQSELIELNDTARKSFNEIADWIQENIGVNE